MLNREPSIKDVHAQGEGASLKSEILSYKRGYEVLNSPKCEQGGGQNPKQIVDIIYVLSLGRPRQLLAGGGNRQPNNAREAL